MSIKIRHTHTLIGFLSISIWFRVPIANLMQAAVVVAAEVRRSPQLTPITLAPRTCFLCFVPYWFGVFDHRHSVSPNDNYNPCHVGKADPPSPGIRILPEGFRYLSGIRDSVSDQYPRVYYLGNICICPKNKIIICESKNLGFSLSVFETQPRYHPPTYHPVFTPKIIFHTSHEPS